MSGLAVGFICASASAGCVTIGPPHGVVDPHDAELTSIVVRVQPGARGWEGSWEKVTDKPGDTNARLMTGPGSERAPSRNMWLLHRPDNRQVWDRRISIAELAYVDSRSPAELTREQILAKIVAGSRSSLDDLEAEFEEVAIESDPRFGKSAVHLAVKATESAAKAGARPRRTIFTAIVRFVPASESIRFCQVVYEERGGPLNLSPDGWRDFLTWLALKPADRS